MQILHGFVIYNRGDVSSAKTKSQEIKAKGESTSSSFSVKSPHSSTGVVFLLTGLNDVLNGCSLMCLLCCFISFLCATHKSVELAAFSRFTAT